MWPKKVNEFIILCSTGSSVVKRKLIYKVPIKISKGPAGILFISLMVVKWRKWRPRLQYIVFTFLDE